MKSITIQELTAMLEAKRGASFVTILTRTKPVFVGGKKSPMFGVEKSSKVNGVINWSYQNAVNNQRVREDQPTDSKGEVEFFEPEARKWGVRLTDAVGRLLPTVAGKVKTVAEYNEATKNGVTLPKYLEIKVQKSLGYSFYRGNVRVPNEDVLPHLPKKTEGRRQEVDSPVILRDYALENIKAIRIDGELYVIQG